MKWGQKSVSSTPGVCEILNKYFQSVFTTTSDLTNIYGCGIFLLDDYDISLEKIPNIMQSLDVSKSNGHDCLPPLFLTHENFDTWLISHDKTNLYISKFLENW